MRYLISLLLAGIATPALAQHVGHDMDSMPASAQDHAAERPTSEATIESAHPDHGMMAKPNRGDVSADPHRMHDMSTMDPPMQDPPIGPPPSAAFSGPEHAADSVFDPAVMAAARAETEHAMGNIVTSQLLIDRFEYRRQGGSDRYLWDGQYWIGGDIDKLTIKSEGEGRFGELPEQVETQALWTHAIDPWFDVQLGVRHDFRPDPERTYAVVGVQGLAPYWFELEGSLFLSTKGELTARVSGEYDLRLTQKLVLQPRVELNLSAQDIAKLGTGSGLTTGEAGLRLRYAFVPQFAPYVGVSWERAFGETRGYRAAAGESSGGWSFVAGIRAWF